jgi:hypothetical protein
VSRKPEITFLRIRKRSFESQQSVLSQFFSEPQKCRRVACPVRSPNLVRIKLTTWPIVIEDPRRFGARATPKLKSDRHRIHTDPRPP